MTRLSRFGMALVRGASRRSAETDLPQRPIAIIKLVRCTQSVPTVLRIEGFRFFFWANEGNEPTHIHVEHQNSYAKFWLSPVSLARARGFSASELNRLHNIVRSKQTFFLEKWNEFFTR